jgi:diguanylate cyclase (GGDEF)-like protein
MTHALARRSSYVAVAVAFICSVLLGAEFDLVALATGSQPRQEKAQLDELLMLSAFFSMVLAALSMFNGRLARNERGKRAAVERAANLDALTAIANRRLFFERLETALGRASAGGCAVLLLDLDGFKAINDTHGHAAGDLVLMHVARQIDAHKGCDALAARLGGDEFALVVEGSAATRANVDELVARLRRAITEPVSHGGESLAVGASIGTAFSSEGIATPAALLEAADGAMYRAKRRNRDALAA